MKRSRQSPPEATGPADPAPGRRLIAYRTGPNAPRIVAAPATRAWMDDTPGRYAYRCLPLTVANQNGWLLLNPAGFDVMWNGGRRADGLRFRLHDRSSPAPVGSVFGSGILTWRVPYLFRTPPGWDLAVRGPANQVKAGAVALDGLVETDWAVATFTMNWKLTSAFRWLRFARDEPFCMIQPQRRADLESFEPEILPLASDPELAAAFERWADSRTSFVFGRMAEPPSERRHSWQKDYFRGAAGDRRAAEHRVKIELRPFTGPSVTVTDRDPGSGDASSLWKHYVRRAPGLTGGATRLARLRAWAGFWLGAVRR